MILYHLSWYCGEYSDYEETWIGTYSTAEGRDFAMMTHYDEVEEANGAFSEWESVLDKDGFVDIDAYYRDIYNEGWGAGYDDLLVDNPYQQGTVEAVEWANGYIQGSMDC